MLIRLVHLHLPLASPPSPPSSSSDPSFSLDPYPVPSPEHTQINRIIIDKGWICLLVKSIPTSPPCSGTIWSGGGLCTGSNYLHTTGKCHYRLQYILGDAKFDDDRYSQFLAMNDEDNFGEFFGDYDDDDHDHDIDHDHHHDNDADDDHHHEHDVNKDKDDDDDQPHNHDNVDGHYDHVHYDDDDHHH